MADASEVDLTRRDLIKAGAAATVGASLTLRDAVAAQLTSPATAPAFFSASELALAEELAEMIIPADAHSPGARAAKLSPRISTPSWPRRGTRRTARRGVTGLRQVDQLSQKLNAAPFLQSAAEQRRRGADANGRERERAPSSRRRSSSGS